MKENKTISLETQKRLLKGEGTFQKVFINFFFLKFNYFLIFLKARSNE